MCTTWSDERITFASVTLFKLTLIVVTKQAQVQKEHTKLLLPAFFTVVHLCLGHGASEAPLVGAYVTILEFTSA